MRNIKIKTEKVSVWVFAFSNVNLHNINFKVWTEWEWDGGMHLQWHWKGRESRKVKIEKTIKHYPNNHKQNANEEINSSIILIINFSSENICSHSIRFELYVLIAVDIECSVWPKRTGVRTFNSTYAVLCRSSKYWNSWASI